MHHFENDVAYIDGWLKKLKEDKRFILFASSKAQRAIDFILFGPAESNGSEGIESSTQSE
jgi:antirestriction protein ArdC